MTHTSNSGFCCRVARTKLSHFLHTIFMKVDRVQSKSGRAYRTNRMAQPIRDITVLLLLTTIAVHMVSPVVGSVIVPMTERSFRPMCYCLVIAVSNKATVYPDDNGLARCTRDAAEICENTKQNSFPRSFCSRVTQAAEYDTKYGYVTDTMLSYSAAISETMDCHSSVHLYALLANHCHPTCLTTADKYQEHANSIFYRTSRLSPERASIWNMSAERMS